MSTTKFFIVGYFVLCVVFLIAGILIAYYSIANAYQNIGGGLALLGVIVGIIGAAFAEEAWEAEK